MIAGGVSWHEHMCPVCGALWSCSGGEKEIIERRRCDECQLLDKP